jgi:hypothetical protein
MFSSVLQSGTDTLTPPQLNLASIFPTHGSQDAQQVILLINVSVATCPFDM